MDVDDQNKETAKFTIVIESDLSLKLDHTELKPIIELMYLKNYYILKSVANNNIDKRK